MNIKSKLSEISDKLSEKGLSKDSDIIKDLLENLSNHTPVDRVMKLWEQRVDKAKNSSEYPKNVLEVLSITVSELESTEKSERQTVINRYYGDFSEEDIQEYIKRLKSLQADLSKIL